MEDSVNSSYNDTIRSGDCDFEESGWTMYLEEFFASNNHLDNNGEIYSSFSFENSSLVSDAASLVLKKSHKDVEDSYKTYNNSLSLINKRRTHLVDDALEDTASSPVNSPKVYNLVNQFKGDHNMNLSQEKGIIGTSRQVVVERSDDVGFIGRESECTELKKRGLCLVPLRMVANYFG